jgi:Lanthionine-containing peptide SapB precursor RamS
MLFVLNLQDIAPDPQFNPMGGSSASINCGGSNLSIALCH